MTTIWVDHLEDLTRAARAYEAMLKEVNSTMENNHSDLLFEAEPLRVTLDGEDTGWRIAHYDEITWLVLDEEEVDTITPVG